MFEIGLDGFGEVRTENTLCRLGDPPTCQTDIFTFAFGGKALLESNENQHFQILHLVDISLKMK